MNSKDFIQALRKVIREEVQTAVRTELNKFSTVLAEQKVTTHTSHLTQVDAYKPNKVKKSKPIQYSENPMLNEILNSTVGFRGDGPAAYLEEEISHDEFAEWPTMKMNSMPSMAKPIIPTTDINGNRVNANDLPEEVVTALTKDYSALMKAIDKKKGK